MEDMNKWMEASFDLIRAGFAPGADEDAKRRAAGACLALHTMLSPARIVPFPSEAAPAAEPESDVLDVIMARLQPFISTAPVGFTPPAMPGPK